MEIDAVKGENIQLRDYNENYVTRICELEERTQSNDDKLKISNSIQLEMINNLNEEIESLRGELKFKDESMAGVVATNVTLTDRLSSLDKTTKAALNIGSSSSITSDSPSSTPPPS